MMYVYLGIIALIVIFILKNLFAEKDLFFQIDAALVLVPLILRLLLIK